MDNAVGHFGNVYRCVDAERVVFHAPWDKDLRSVKHGLDEDGINCFLADARWSDVVCGGVSWGSHESFGGWRFVVFVLTDEGGSAPFRVGMLYSIKRLSSGSDRGSTCFTCLLVTCCWRNFYLSPLAH